MTEQQQSWDSNVNSQMCKINLEAKPIKKDEEWYTYVLAVCYMFMLYELRDSHEILFTHFLLKAKKMCSGCIIKCAVLLV